MPTLKERKQQNIKKFSGILKNLKIVLYPIFFSSLCQLVKQHCTLEWKRNILKHQRSQLPAQLFLLSSFHLRTAQEPSKIPQANIYILRYICLLLKELECSTQRLPHKLSTLSSQRTRAYPNAERHAKLTSYDKNVRRQEQKPITSRGIVGEIARGVKS